MGRAAFLALAMLTASAPVLQAGPIERACLSSGRSAANRALCACIQNAANLTLTRSDQSMAARFFRDPERAQAIRSSDSRSHDAFWERYTGFGATAEAMCGAGGSS
jgi:hypothetical protein